MTKIAIILLLFIVTTVKAEVRLPSVINSHMVLQQKSKVPLWGWANPGEIVSITTEWGKTSMVKTSGEGKWMVKINTPEAGGPYRITFRGENVIELTDVLIGEVWVCSGQSNMVRSLKGSLDSEQDIAQANFSKIRLFKAKLSAASKPQDDCDGNWNECTPENAKDFSAVAYYFGKELHDKLFVPIGLIQTAWGGSNAEAWMSIKALSGNTSFKPILDRFKIEKEEYQIQKTTYDRSLTDWEKLAEEAVKAGKPAPAKPKSPVLSSNHSPSYLYNGMLYPFIPYGIKGVIWYQGENNAGNGRSYQYRQLLPDLISNWRKDWNLGSFPFYFVQLPPFNYKNPDGSALAELREAQLLTLSLKNTGMAVTMDIGDSLNVHPKNKKDIGKRLALWALAKDYKQKRIVYSGPIYKSMKIQDDRIIIAFEHIGGGLIASGGLLKTFTIAGEDKKFIKGSAVIIDNKIVVKALGINKPVAVRYAWRNSDVPNLFNKEGLPASSFRTDDWPGETYNNR
jgi:sialate O-acetylesterase